MIHERVRSLVLTVLVVGTVFAGTGAGSVAAGNVPGAGPDVRAATQYHDAADDAVVELAFNEAIDVASVNDTTHVFVTFENGSTIPLYDGAAGYPDGVTERTRSAGRLVVEIDERDAIANVTVDGITDAGGTAMDRQTVDVRFTPTTVDTTDRGDDETYRGANVSLVRDTAVGTTFDIEGPENSSFDMTRGTGPNSEVYVLDTDERALGTYTVSDGTDSVDLTLESLGLRVSLDEASVDDTEQITGTVEANDIDRDVELTLHDDGDGVATREVRIGSDGTADFAFDPADAGNYTVEARDRHTDVTAVTDAFAVGDAGTPTADFGSPTYAEARGDEVAVEVTLNNTDTATVQFGETATANYNLTAELVDEDGDGRVRVEFDTFEAGHGGAAPGDVLSVDGEDSITEVRQGGPFTTDYPGAVGTDTLEAGQYELRVAAGETDGAVTDPDGVATLSLSERATTDVRIWTAPGDDFDSIDDADNLRDARTEGALTRTDTVAAGDLVVVAITANGLEGAFDDTESFQRRSADGRLFALTLESTPGPNDEQDAYDVSALASDDVSVVSNDTDDTALDTHYVVIDSAALTDLFDDPPSGDSYVADFDVHANGPDNDLGAAASDQDTAAIVERSASLDTDGERIVLDAASNATVTGETTLAPNTDLTLQLRSDGATEPFLVETPAAVEADGSVTATVNLSAASPGDNATAQFRLGSDDIGDDYAVHVVEPAVAPTTPSSTAEPAPTTPRTTVARATETAIADQPAPSVMVQATETTTPTTESTAGGGGPGFTVAGAVVALAAAALLAARRDR